MNRLEYASNANTLSRENLMQALSQIRDVDVATETAELIRSQILQQAQTSVLGQANLSMQLALQLLRF
jgi:flagellin